jgi:hypothetical protein
MRWFRFGKDAEGTMHKTHKCFAVDCGSRVPAKMLMCNAHCIALPKRLRDAVWQAYVAGQEHDPNLATMEWRAAVQACRDYLLERATVRK